MKKLILIGDSIRMGYQAEVIRELTGFADVWAPEQNGGTSANILTHLDEWVLRQSPDIVHINCGLHDLRKDFDTAQPAIPLDEYEANVRRIIGRILAETDSTVIWATTTPVNEAWHHQRKGFDRLEADVIAYNGVAIGVAKALGIPINNLFEVVNPDHLQPGGVHFTDAGCALLGKAVAEYIQPFLDVELHNS